MSEHAKILAVVPAISHQHPGWVDSLKFEVIEVLPGGPAGTDPGKYVRFTAMENQVLEREPKTVEVIFPLATARLFLGSVWMETAAAQGLPSCPD